MKPLENYIRDLHHIRTAGAGTDETSYYTPLANLFNEVGQTLKPKVRCILNLKNQGAGFPDGGFFTSEQFEKAAAVAPLPGQNPARGVIEVKSTKPDAGVTADGAQVSRYWDRYRQVLVTNYRDFVLVGQDADGKPATLETYRLAESESTFWGATATPHRMNEEHGERFTQFLKRVLLHAAPLAEPEDVAWFLASYARDARMRIERTDLPALAAVRTALEEALGIQFEGRKGDHFFRSTLVQTLFYGVFAAWVLWGKQHLSAGTGTRFDWRMAAWSLRVPMIKALFEQVATPTKLGPLGLVEVLDWTGAMLNRVDRTAFFTRFEEAHAVQYFYEPFLQAFDPQLRKELGVWYTPPEIVQYMVARVDMVLREELNLPDGLADPRVYVLDPCCGTGAYLVEVLKRIALSLQEQGADALSSDDLKRTATERVFGFEILPAPFVIAHLQLGLMLQQMGAPLSESQNERVGVYLTNALTGWEPPKEPKTRFLFPELEEERDAAERVKREKPILVILGNPPYNAFAGVSPQEEQGLVEPYKEGLISEWGIKKFNLDDLYVRFFRLAERRIAEQTGKGVVCYISNHSWVSEPSFVVLRQHLMKSFDRFWIENMHGNRKISEYAPDGRTSETIFAIPGFSPGIQQGVVISLWVKKGKADGKPQVLFRDDLNAAKAIERRAQLVASLKAEDFDTHYESATPARSNRFSFRPSDVDAHYLKWPRLVDLCASPPYNGPVERRGFALISIDREALSSRMQKYFDPSVSNDKVQQIYPSLMMTGNRIVGPDARHKILQEFSYDPKCIVRYPLKPFDVRFCYLENLRPLFSEPSPRLLAHRYVADNAFFITRDTADKDPEGPPFYFSQWVCDYDCLSGHARHFPIYLRPELGKKAVAQSSLFAGNDAQNIKPTANLSPTARSYLAKLGITDPDADAETAGLIWMHAIAIGYSPAYRTENADGIRQDWPRVPLPHSRDLLLASAALGVQVAALLDTEFPVPGVTSGTIRPELRSLAVISRVGGGALAPDAFDLALTAGWGHAGKGDVTMPGKGKAIERDYTAEERASIGEESIQRLGETTCDIYLNEVAYWRNIPIHVWKYTIGGYQVIKKWLSYREQKLLGRPLTVAEVREVTTMARRIAAILWLDSALDTNYRHVIASAYDWPTLGLPSEG